MDSFEETCACRVQIIFHAFVQSVREILNKKNEETSFPEHGSLTFVKTLPDMIIW